MSDLISMDKRGLIKAFRDYQKEWLYSHHDFELSTRLEEVIAKFLDDTAERFMVEKSQLLEEGTTKDATSNLIRRVDAIDIERRATVDTNPSHFYSHQKFEQFMNDVEISSFGRWQWANGFNTALTAISIDLKQLPSAEPKTPQNGSITCVKSEKMHDRTMGDCISRQDAIDYIKTQRGRPFIGITLEEAIIMMIEEVPSAEPEIIRCKDCKHWGRKDAYKDGSTMVVCKQGRSIDADGFCHHAERKEE